MSDEQTEKPEAKGALNEAVAGTQGPKGFAAPSSPRQQVNGRLDRAIAAGEIIPKNRMG